MPTEPTFTAAEAAALAARFRLVPVQTVEGAVIFGLSFGLAGGQTPSGASGPAPRSANAGVASNPTFAQVGAGDTLLVAGVWAAPAATPSGWTEVVNRQDSSGTFRLYVYKKENAAGTETALNPGVNPDGSWIALAYPASGVDSVAAAATGSGANITCPSVTVVAPPVTLIDFVLGVADSAAPVLTAPSGSAALNHVPDPNTLTTLASFARSVSAAGATGTRTATANATVAKAVGSVAVRL